MDFSGLKILICDDEETYRKFFATLIRKKFNCHVDSVNNPKQMFDAIKDSLPDLIMLDMQMPLMDGLTALEILRSHKSTRKVPVVACSAMSDPALIIKLSGLGIMDYILKSSDSDIILEKIQKILNTLLQAK